MREKVHVRAVEVGGVIYHLLDNGLAARYLDGQAVGWLTAAEFGSLLGRRRFLSEEERLRFWDRS